MKWNHGFILGKEVRRIMEVGMHYIRNALYNNGYFFLDPIRDTS